MTQPKSPDHRNAPSALWRRVCVFMVEMVKRFGLPQEIAARRTLAFKDYKQIVRWLRAGEALMRRLLLIEAALLKPKAPPHGPPAPSPASMKSRNLSQSDLDPENPASWRVSFRITVADRRLPGGTRCFNLHRPEQAEAPDAGWKPAVRVGAHRSRAALPLARRLEALLRIYDNPAPFARRLAARLRRTATRVTRIAKDAWKKSRHLIGRDLHDALIAPIEEAQRVLAPDSS